VIPSGHRPAWPIDETLSLPVPGTCPVTLAELLSEDTE
jgi:hypothetical protein